MEDEKEVEKKKDEKLSIPLRFKAIVDSIPTELTNHIKYLEVIRDNEALDDELQPLIDEAIKVRRHFFYRRKRYRESGNDVEITKFMKLVHDVVIMIHKHTIELERILSQ